MHGRERLLHRAEDPHNAAHGAVSLVDDLDAPHRCELRSDEQASIVADVLDHAEPSRAPSHQEPLEESVVI
jgi:hypothetical protein